MNKTIKSNEFHVSFALSRTEIFSVSYYRCGSNKEPYFTTSGGVFNHKKTDWSRCGQCQRDITENYSEAEEFYNKWNPKHLYKLTDEQYEEMTNDLEKLFSKYPQNVIHQGDKPSDIHFWEKKQIAMEFPRPKKIYQKREVKKMKGTITDKSVFTYNKDNKNYNIIEINNKSYILDTIYIINKQGEIMYTIEDYKKTFEGLQLDINIVKDIKNIKKNVPSLHSTGVTKYFDIEKTRGYETSQKTIYNLYITEEYLNIISIGTFLKYETDNHLPIADYYYCKNTGNIFIIDKPKNEIEMNYKKTSANIDEIINVNVYNYKNFIKTLQKINESTTELTKMYNEMAEIRKQYEVYNKENHLINKEYYQDAEFIRYKLNTKQ